MPRRRPDEDEIELTEADREEIADADYREERTDEDRLPWLEAVEEDGEGEGPSMVKLLGALVIGLLAIGLIVGGLFWLGNRNRPGGNGEVIAAPEGDYKVRPDDPGGMNVQGEGDISIAASEGVQPSGQIDTNAAPEAPVARPAPAPAAQPSAPSAQPAPAPARPAPAQPAPAAGPTIQLGAFSSAAAANGAWTALAGRFRYLAPLGHSVVPVQAGGRTLYRLRASGPDAAGICRRLQAAGEACSPVG